MQVRVNIEYDEVLRLIKQLPYKEKQRLSSEIARDLHPEKEIENIEVKEFQDFLLQGPVMSDGQFREFKELRKDFARWIES